MKTYIKPAIKLAGDSTGGSAGGCANKADMDLIASILGGSYDSSQIFAESEGCAVGIPADIYCKFTSANMVFGS